MDKVYALGALLLCGSLGALTAQTDDCSAQFKVIQSNELNCSTGSTTLYTNGGAPVSWTLPDGTVSNDYTLQVKEAGVYTALMQNYADPSCQKEVSLEVDYTDFNPVIATANASNVLGGELNATTAELYSLGGKATAWEGPNGFSAEGGNTVVTEAGVYTVTVVDYNQGNCVSTASVEVVLEDTLVSTPVDTTVVVNPVCDPAEFFLSKSDLCVDGDLGIWSQGGPVTSWTAPSGLAIDAANIKNSNSISGITEAGVYTAVIDGNAGWVQGQQCGTYTKTIEILAEDLVCGEDSTTVEVPCDAANFYINKSDICVDGHVGLWTQGGPALVWTGPNGLPIDISYVKNANSIHNLDAVGTYTAVIDGDAGWVQGQQCGPQIVTMEVTAADFVCGTDTTVVVEACDDAAFYIEKSGVCEDNNVSLWTKGGPAVSWTSPSGVEVVGDLVKNNNTIFNLVETGTYTAVIDGNAGWVDGQQCGAKTVSIDVVAVDFVCDTDTTIVVEDCDAANFYIGKSDLCVDGHVGLWTEGGPAVSWTTPSGEAIDAALIKNENTIFNLVDAGVYTAVIDGNAGWVEGKQCGEQTVSIEVFAADFVCDTDTVVVVDECDAAAFYIEKSGICEDDNVALWTQGGPVVSWTSPSGEEVSVEYVKNENTIFNLVETGVYTAVIDGNAGWVDGKQCGEQTVAIEVTDADFVCLDASVSVYPTQTNSTITISSLEAGGLVQIVQLTSGTVVYNGVVSNEETIDVSAYVAGTYVVNYTAVDGNSTTKQFVKF